MNHCVPECASTSIFAWVYKKLSPTKNTDRIRTFWSWIINLIINLTVASILINFWLHLDEIKNALCLGKKIMHSINLTMKSNWYCIGIAIGKSICMANVPIFTSMALAMKWKYWDYWTLINKKLVYVERFNKHAYFW